MKKVELLLPVTFKEKSPYFKEYGRVFARVQEVKDNQVSLHIKDRGHLAWVSISQLEFY